MNTKHNNYPYVFIAPAFIVFFTFYGLPTLLSFYYSLTDWNTFNPTINFAGFHQFETLFQDEVLRIALKNTLIYSIGTALLQNLSALILAFLLNNTSKFTNIFRSVFFFPCILSPLIVTYVFMAIFYPTGMFNRALSILSGQDVKIQWLGDRTYSMYAIIFVAVWFGTGILMAIYLAALKNIPSDNIEAARIDGAGKLKLMWHVEIPMIAPGFTINIVYSLIAALKVFAVVYLLTGGGPGRSTEVMNTFIFNEFARGRMAYGTAIGVIAFLLICVITFPVLIFMRKREASLE